MVVIGADSRAEDATTRAHDTESACPFTDRTAHQFVAKWREDTAYLIFDLHVGLRRTLTSFSQIPLIQVSADTKRTRARQLKPRSMIFVVHEMGVTGLEPVTSAM